MLEAGSRRKPRDGLPTLHLNVTHQDDLATPLTGGLAGKGAPRGGVALTGARIVIITDSDTLSKGVSMSRQEPENGGIL